MPEPKRSKKIGAKGKRVQTKPSVPQGDHSLPVVRTPVIEFGIACCLFALAVVLAVAIGA